MKPILIAAGAWCLVLTFVVFREYAVYLLSRWVICAAGIYGAVNLKSPWRWALAVVAVLFNPIASIHLGPDLWIFADGAAAAVFFISASLAKTSTAQEL